MSTIEDSEDNTIYVRKKDGIEIEAVDPIQDVMSEKEIDDASERFSSLLE